jgi:hypothetical protein
MGNKRGKDELGMNTKSNTRTAHLDPKRPEDAAPKGVHFPIKRTTRVSSGSLTSFLNN